MFFAVGQAELGGEEAEGRRNFTGYKDHFAGPMLLYRLEIDGEIPAGSSENEELTDYIGDLLLLHSRVNRWKVPKTAGNGELFQIYRVEMPELHKSSVSLINNYKNNR